jgi:hypothetical protein
MTQSHHYQMNVNNPPKLIISLVLIISMTVLMLTNTVTSEAGVPFLTAIGGYVLGNGIAARRGQPSEPIIGASEQGV